MGGCIIRCLPLSPAGDHIFKEGELGQEMYIMEKGAVMLREQQIGGSGGSLEPLGLFLEPLGLFLRTSIPFIRRILSAFLRA